MARFTDPVCKRCRREQMKLYLKGTRCYTPKCPIDREAPPPGMHGTRRSKVSEYGVRLREKQKLKFFYGILERQFVPLLRDRRPQHRQHRRSAADAARTPPRQRRPPPRLRQLAPRGPAARVPRPRAGQRPQVRRQSSMILRAGDLIKREEEAPQPRNMARTSLQSTAAAGAGLPRAASTTTSRKADDPHAHPAGRGPPHRRKIREQLIIEIATR